MKSIWKWSSAVSGGRERLPNWVRSRMQSESSQRGDGGRGENIGDERLMRSMVIWKLQLSIEFLKKAESEAIFLE
jgi:hypothetical protein